MVGDDAQHDILPFQDERKAKARVMFSRPGASCSESSDVFSPAEKKKMLIWEAVPSKASFVFLPHVPWVDLLPKMAPKAQAPLPYPTRNLHLQMQEIEAELHEGPLSHCCDCSSSVLTLQFGVVVRYIQQAASSCQRFDDCSIHKVR